MATSSQMLAAARTNLGLRGRPNTITRAYASRNGDAFLNAAWCDMAVTYWARKSGATSAVLPKGDRAYTVWHAQDFQAAKRWYTGTKANVDKAKPGDVIFFDWGGSDSVGAIDHVGVVEKTLGGGRVQTIEGNTGDACARRVRSYVDIAGYGRPAYTAPKPLKPTARYPFKASTLIRKGWNDSEGVRVVQKRLNELGSRLVVDGDFGPRTETAVRAFQKKKRLVVDGIVGPKTWAKLFG
ncbi:peptidoglycan-binding protein [Actinomadura sp. HBU206391]|uniref:peptidoglycan-binding protein n=1 Tax=Actinomadura sp. HBU206391 TaxID=2731692 RepID=UPI0016506B0C|nr:peptidoglycan-binding protein [Actinomadura sp. HBU206391]MBC6458435.1 peptidoglycan-binding protein [Actinomadura sp. HBU206391]